MTTNKLWYYSILFYSRLFIQHSNMINSQKQERFAYAIIHPKLYIYHASNLYKSYEASRSISSYNSGTEMIQKTPLNNDFNSHGNRWCSARRDWAPVHSSSNDRKRSMNRRERGLHRGDSQLDLRGDRSCTASCSGVQRRRCASSPYHPARYTWETNSNNIILHRSHAYSTFTPVLLQDSF